MGSCLGSFFFCSSAGVVSGVLLTLHVRGVMTHGGVVLRCTAHFGGVVRAYYVSAGLHHRVFGTGGNRLGFFRVIVYLHATRASVVSRFHFSWISQGYFLRSIAWNGVRPTGGEGTIRCSLLAEPSVGTLCSSPCNDSCSSGDFLLMAIAISPMVKFLPSISASFRREPGCVQGEAVGPSRINGPSVDRVMWAVPNNHLSTLSNGLGTSQMRSEPLPK